MDFNVTEDSDGEQGPLLIPVHERYIEAFVLTVICITAFVGNTSLWIIILREKGFQTTSNALLLCLSAADWLVSVVNMPVIVYTIMKGDWMFNDATCVGLGFMTMLTFVASVMSLGTISFNRYVHICHPQKLKTLYTAKKTALWIAGTWTLSACLASPPLFGWGRYGYLPGQSVCFADWPTSISYTFFMVGMCFGGPCTAMTFCYVNILLTVKRSKRKVGLSTPVASAMNSPEANTQNPPVFPTQEAESYDSTTQLHPNKKDDAENDVVDPTSQAASSVENNNLPDRVTTLILHDNTVTESSSDNMCEIPVQIETGTENGKYESANGTDNGHIQKRIKKPMPLDSTVRKSYRAGIINSMGSNSSLDKVIQQQLAVENMASVSLKDSDTSHTVKRKLSFGSNLSKRRLSAGKKLFGNFLHVPGKKTVQAEDLAARRLREKEKRLKAEELRLTTSLFVVILVFVFCWLPFCCTMFWSVFTDDPQAVPRPIDMATLLLGCANSMCNPIIYGVMNKRFRKGFLKLFCCHWMKLLRRRTKSDGSLQMNSTLSS